MNKHLEFHETSFGIIDTYPEDLSPMPYQTEQENFWAGDFGLNYIDRNISEPLLYSKVALWARMLQATNNVSSIRELGCNVGLNLVALKRLQPSLILSGYEINPEAAMQAAEFDLPPEAPSFITRVCGFGFHILLRQFEQARRVRSPQISQALGALQRVFGCPEMSAV